MVGHRLGSRACVSSLPAPAAIYEPCCGQEPREACLSAAVQPSLHSSWFTVSHRPRSEGGRHQERVPTVHLCTTVGFHFFYRHRAGVTPQNQAKGGGNSPVVLNSGRTPFGNTGSSGAPRHPHQVSWKARLSVAGNAQGRAAAQRRTHRVVLPFCLPRQRLSPGTHKTWSPKRLHQPPELLSSTWLLTGSVGPSGQ